MSEAFDSQNLVGEKFSPSTDTHRSVFQQDYDRLLFSTPVRRLADKTQVWPMEENDGVRTRLTHSHEVANLARSIGARAFKGAREAFRQHGCNDDSLAEIINPLSLSIGLGHDLGNPPFGHQGRWLLVFGLNGVKTGFSLTPRMAGISSPLQFLKPTGLSLSSLMETRRAFVY